MSQAASKGWCLGSPANDLRPASLNGPLPSSCEAEDLPCPWKGRMDELLADFIAETRETLEAIAGELVAWEGDPSDRSRLDAIFRFVHTVKGSCGFLDLPRLQGLSHAAEDALAEVRAGARAPDAALVSAVLAIIDRIGELTDVLEREKALPDGADATLIAALTASPATDDTAADAPQAIAAHQRVVARSIRLPVELLDRMMAGVSDMVLARNELSRALRDLGAPQAAEVAFDRLSQCVAEMRDVITRTRMARIDTLFAMLPRMVRDLSSQLGRTVRLELDGGDVELDREMIEMIRDPLTHIVRNALDHGIESREERQAAGKPASGRLRIAARQSGNQILIDAIDDGRGIDANRLADKAVAAGQITAQAAVAMSGERKLDLIFMAGLSTAKAVTEISGRGVGMDVVRANVERIGGAVEIESQLGAGTRITMRVPLTLTIIPALTVACGTHRFAVPRSAIDEIVRVNNMAVRLQSIGDGLLAEIRGQTCPVIALGALLHCAEEMEDRPVLVVVRATGGERFALAVDRVLDHEELVVKPAAPAIMATGVYAGTTLPDNSRPMLLLDVAGLATAAGLVAGTSAMEEAEVVAREAPAVPTLLFRDLDQVERGVRLALIERIEDVDVSQIAESAGRLQLAHQDMLVPLVARAAMPEQGRVRILQLGDGTTRIAYAIDQVHDVMELPPELIPAASAGPVAGTTLVDGRPVEMLDAYWLFGTAGTAPSIGAQPVCLLPDERDDWSREMLAPLLVAAGYRVAFGAPADEQPDVVIVTSAGAESASTPAPTVRLRASPGPVESGDASIWRYDRAGLLEAVRSAAQRGWRS